jgi:CheY-like chemotaxis protein
LIATIGVAVGDRRSLDVDLTGVHVLVVSGDVDALEILDAVLRHAGALVSRADSVQAARDVAHRLEPDVILCDFAPPLASKLEVVRAMRRDPTVRRVPIVVLTNYSTPQSRQQARAVGVIRYLEKPIDGVALCRAMRSVLGPRREHD